MRGQQLVEAGISTALETVTHQREGSTDGQPVQFFAGALGCTLSLLEQATEALNNFSPPLNPFAGLEMWFLCYSAKPLPAPNTCRQKCRQKRNRSHYFQHRCHAAAALWPGILSISDNQCVPVRSTRIGFHRVQFYALFSPLTYLYFNMNSRKIFLISEFWTFGGLQMGQRQSLCRNVYKNQQRPELHAKQQSCQD